MGLFRFSNLTALFVAATLPLTIYAEERVDLYTIHRIRAEEQDNSKLMDTMFYLTDVNGPRLTNSPNYFAAADWVVKQMGQWGISSKQEKWAPFGRSWQLKKFYAAMVSPQYQPIIGFPLAWTKATNGAVTADAIIAPIYTEADMAKYKGQLRGKLVLTQTPREVELAMKPLANRFNEAELQQREKAPDMTEQNQVRNAGRSRLPAAWQNLKPAEVTALRKKINDFLGEEGVAGILTAGYTGDGGTVFGAAAGSREVKDAVPPPTIAVTPEHYNRIHRLVSHNIPVKVEMDIQADILDVRDSANVIAELPGSGKNKDEIVMLGAHLDSWHGGTGATDNAAGSAVMIETMRILKSLGKPLNRTVRMALWSGEEEGLLGSKAYVKEHFGDPATMKITAEQSKLAGYFNLDNGSGRVRGIYLQGNDMCRPIFEQWFAPFKDQEAGAITIRNTGGTDHLSFDAVGIPGFQFIQDELEYSTRTHHSNMDVYDHVSPSDLKQAATVVASFVYMAATRDEMLPRKPLPKAKPEPAKPTE